MGSSDVDIAMVGQTLADASEKVCSAWDRLEQPPYGVETRPPEIRDAFGELLETLGRWDELDPDQGPGVSRVAEYGLGLIRELSATAALLELRSLSREVELQAYPFAVWAARHGASLGLLEPVVNAVAYLADHSSGPEDLQRLFKGISEIVEAVDPRIRGDLEASGPGSPWRLLLLNRAIVATRSHQPSLMEAAFTAVIRHLPDDAPRFFAEGMEQMDLQEYPPQVRRVMERYYDQWGTGRRAH